MNIAEDAELEKLAEDYAKKEEYGYTMQPHIIPAFIAGWKAKEAALKQDTVIIEISVYEIAYMHRYGNFAINVYVCPAANESDALNKFWEGRVKDNWEVKNITVHKAAIENDTAKQYLKSEYDLQIIKMKALGIDTESQTFEQCVNTVIYMAGGLQAKEDIESDAIEFAEWIDKNFNNYGLHGKYSWSKKFPEQNTMLQITTAELYKLFKNKANKKI